jgi:hypothetical protein
MRDHLLNLCSGTNLPSTVSFCPAQSHSSTQLILPSTFCPAQIHSSTQPSTATSSRSYLDLHRLAQSHSSAQHSLILLPSTVSFFCPAHSSAQHRLILPSTDSFCPAHSGPAHSGPAHSSAQLILPSSFFCPTHSPASSSLDLVRLL